MPGTPLVPQFPRGRAVAVVRAAGSTVLGHEVLGRRPAAGARLFPGHTAPEPGLVAPSLGAAAGSQSEQLQSFLVCFFWGCPGQGKGQIPPPGLSPPRAREAQQQRGCVRVRTCGDKHPSLSPPPPLISNIWRELGPVPSDPLDPTSLGGGLCGARSVGHEVPLPPITPCLSFPPG